MSLQEQLTALKVENLAQFSPEVKDTLLGDLQKLAESGLGKAAPKAGDKLKDFALPNQHGQIVRLADLRQKGPVVVTFYRGGWCPYCHLELHAYQQILPQIQAAGATLVAITPERPEESLRTAQRHALEFEVLTDRNSSYGREIGIVFTLSENARTIYQSFGIDLEKHNGQGQFDLPLPATFVVNTDGTLAFAFVEVDYTRRAEPAEVVQVLQSLAK